MDGVETCFGVKCTRCGRNYPASIYEGGTLFVSPCVCCTTARPSRKIAFPFWLIKLMTILALLQTAMLVKLFAKYG